MSDKNTPPKPASPRPQPGRVERETPLRESVNHNGKVRQSGDYVTRNVAPPPAPPMPPKRKK